MDLDIHEQYFQISEKAQILAQFQGKEDASLLVILPEACVHEDLVQKILGAINIQDLNEIKLLYLKGSDGISLFDLVKDTSVNRIISFGFPAAQLGLHIDHRPYEIVSFRSLSLIICADLAIISTSPDHKKALWNSLKKWA